MLRFGARLGCLVALLSVFGGCWAASGSAVLALSCEPAGALVFVSGRAVGRCGGGVVAVGAGAHSIEVSSPGRLPLRFDLLFEPWERYELAGVLAVSVPGLDAPSAGSGVP